MGVIIKRKEASLDLIREGWTSYLIKKDKPSQRYKIVKYEKTTLLLQNAEGLVFECLKPNLEAYEIEQVPNTVEKVKPPSKIKPQYISLKADSDE